MRVCPDCGFATSAGEHSCQEVRDRLLARDFEQPALYWRHHCLAIYAYCVQHALFVRSAKFLAAHLCGLAIALERGGNETDLRKIQTWLSTNPLLVKPYRHMRRRV